jgi:pimeloyl-[acyl-carrier protein] methyl ester esterase
VAQLVLLPGLDGTGVLFRPLVAALSNVDSKVVSYPNDKALSLDEHARWVIHQLPGEKAMLLAESFSGLVALRVLQDAPSRIAAVIFVGAFAEPPRPLLLRLAPLVSRAGPLMRNTPAFLLRQFCLGRDAPVAQLNLLRQALAVVPPQVLANRLAVIGARHSWGKAKFGAPCLYLQAREDRLVPPAAAEWFRGRFERFELERIDGPHFLLQAKPDACAQRISEFSARIGV